MEVGKVDAEKLWRRVPQDVFLLNLTPSSKLCTHIERKVWSSVPIGIIDTDNLLQHPDRF